MSGAGYLNLTEHNLAQQRATKYSFQQQQPPQSPQQQWGASSASQQYGRSVPKDNQQAYVNELAANTSIGAGRIGGKAFLGTELDPANLGEYSRATTSASTAIPLPVYSSSASQNYGQQQQQRYDSTTERHGASNSNVGYQLGHNSSQQQQQSYFSNASSSPAQSQQTTASVSIHRQPYADVNTSYCQLSVPQTTVRPAIQDQDHAQQQNQQHSAISNPARVPTPTQSQAAHLILAHPYSQTATAVIGVHKQTQETDGQAQQAMRMSQSPSMVVTKIHTAQTPSQKRSPALQSAQWGQPWQQQAQPVGYSSNQDGDSQQQQGRFGYQEVHQQQQHHLPVQVQQYGRNSPDLQTQQQWVRQYREMCTRQHQAQQEETDSPQQQPIQHAQIQPIHQVENFPRQQQTQPQYQQQDSQQYGQLQAAQGSIQQQTAALVVSGRTLNQSQTAASLMQNSASPATVRAKPSSAASQRSMTSSRNGKSKPPPKLYLSQALPSAQLEKAEVNNQKQIEVAEIVNHAVCQNVEATQQIRAQASTGGAQDTTLRDTRRDAQSSGVPPQHRNVKHHQTQSLPRHHNTVQQQSNQQHHPEFYNPTEYLPPAHIHSQASEPRQPEPQQQYIHPQYLYNRQLTPSSRNLPESSPVTPVVEDTNLVVEPPPPKQRDNGPAVSALSKFPPASSSTAAPSEPVIEQQSAPPKMSAPEDAALMATLSAPQQNQSATTPMMPEMPTLDPTAPLDPTQMEAHMRALVETMRFYQSRDPNTFHSIWESVRKDNATRPAIMPTSEPSQAAPTSNARPNTDIPSPSAASVRQNYDTTKNYDMGLPESASGPKVILAEDPMEVDNSVEIVETPPQQKRRCNRPSKPGSQPRRFGAKNPPAPAPQAKYQSLASDPVVLEGIPKPQATEEPSHIRVKVPVEPSQLAPQPPPPSVSPLPHTAPAEAKKEENEEIMRAARNYFLQNLCVEIDLNDLRSVLETSANFPAMCAHFEQKGFKFDRGSFAKYLQANFIKKSNPVEQTRQQNGSSAVVATTVVNNQSVQQTAPNNSQVEVPNPGRILGELVGPQQRTTQTVVRPPPYAPPPAQVTQQRPPNPPPYRTSMHGGTSMVPNVSQQPQGQFISVSTGQPIGFQSNHHDNHQRQQQVVQHPASMFHGPLQNGQNPPSQPQQGFRGLNRPNSMVVHRSQILSHSHAPMIPNFTTQPHSHVLQFTNHVPIQKQSPGSNSVTFEVPSQQYIRLDLPQSSNFHPPPRFPPPTNNVVDLTRDPSPPKVIQHPPLLSLSRRKQNKLDPVIPLALPLKREQARRTNKYKTASICRNILRITGRHPTEPALNEHLLPLKDNLHLDLKSDLETVRWDLVDPEQPETMNKDMDARIGANNEDGGHVLYNAQTPGTRKRKSKKSAVSSGLTSPTQQQGSHLNTSVVSTPIANGICPYDTDSEVEFTGSKSKMSSAKRIRRTGPDGDGRKFKKYPCQWHGCRAELHNFDAFTRHIDIVHRDKKTARGSEIYACLWDNCAKSTIEFKTLKEWDAHVDAHKIQVFELLGLGPKVAASDVDSAGSDVDYLFDARGNQVTPIARLAPPDHIWVPPPGHKANKLFKQVHALSAIGAEKSKLRQIAAYKEAYDRAQKLGAGIQVFGHAWDPEGLDDGMGLDAAVIKIEHLPPK